MPVSLTESFSHSGWWIQYKLHEVKKAGQTVVFVHGTPWSSIVFQPIAESLIATLKCNVLLYDLPGYGKSQTYLGEAAGQDGADSNLFNGDTSVKTQASILAALLEELHLKGGHGEQSLPAVIAHDIAGTIVLRAHLLHGCEYRSLMLLDTNCILPWGDGFYKLVRSKPGVFTELPLGIFEAMVRAVIRSACHDPAKLASGWEDALAMPWTGSAENQRSFVRQIAQANDADVAEMLDQGAYEKLRCDVKIMTGAEDAWIPRQKMETLAGLLAHRLKDFVVVPEAGHLLMIDQPERVMAEIVGWLSRPRSLL